MFYVLMALRQGPMCGIDVADFIDRHTAGRVQVGPATLYTILGKFVQEKWIREVEVAGRKRTYQITDRGNKAYEQEWERLRRMLADAGHAQEEAAHGN
jgi:DNA-binding PadR family transcriptional regulator